MKKIIGYKLNELGKRNIAAIAAIVKFDGDLSLLKKAFNWNLDDYGWNIKHESTMRLELEGAGVLNIWCTPVYEKKTAYTPNDLGWKNIKACAAITGIEEKHLSELCEIGLAFTDDSKVTERLRDAKVLDIWFYKVEN